MFVYVVFETTRDVTGSGTVIEDSKIMKIFDSKAKANKERDRLHSKLDEDDQVWHNTERFKVY